MFFTKIIRQDSSENPITLKDNKYFEFFTIICLFGHDCIFFLNQPFCLEKKCIVSALQILRLNIIFMWQNMSNVYLFFVSQADKLMSYQHPKNEKMMQKKKCPHD